MNFTTTQWASLIAASALLAILFLLYGDQIQKWAWKLTGSK
jgi:hypothetical protein